jgi:hypothetical protein
MTRLLAIIPGVTAAAFACMAGAQEHVLLMLGNTDPEVVEFIQGTCEKNAATLDCKMSSIRIKTKLDPKDIPRTLQEVRTNIQEHVEQFSDPRTCAELKEGKLDTVLREGPERVQGLRGENESTASSLDTLLSSIGTLLPLWRAACEKPSEDTLMPLVEYLVDRESRMCKIHKLDFTMRFKRQSEGLWVSNEGPSGLCGRIVVTQLRDQTGNGLFWEWKAKYIYTNPLEPFCEEFGEVIEAFSTRVSQKELHCERFEYGF